MLEFLRAPFLVLKFFYYALMTSITIYADDTTLYCKYDQTSDLWQQLEFAYELESDLRDTVDWYRKWLVDFNAGKTLVLLM